VGGILWTLNHPDVWQLLVAQRGWTQEQRERWCATTARESAARRRNRFLKSLTAQVSVPLP
jgi:hypothetical protein